MESMPECEQHEDARPGPDRPCMISKMSEESPDRATGGKDMYRPGENRTGSGGSAA